MADTAEPTSAIVPVKSAWSSKIVWTQIIGVAAAIVTIWGVSLDAETQGAIVSGILAVQAGITFVLRNWFSSTVTAASISDAAPVDEALSVARVTPRGGVVSALKKVPVFLVAAFLLLAFAAPADAGRRHQSDGNFWGGVIGGILAGPPRYRERERYVPEMSFDLVADCARRFRSYDPATGFYRGYDGYLRRCP